MRSLLLLLVLILFNILTSCAPEAQDSSRESLYFTQLGKDTMWYLGRIWSPTNQTGWVQHYDDQTSRLRVSMPLPDTSVDRLAETVARFNGAGRGSFSVDLTRSIVIAREAYYDSLLMRLPYISEDSKTQVLAKGYIVQPDESHPVYVSIEYNYDTLAQQFAPLLKIQNDRMSVGEIHVLADALGSSRWSFHNQLITIPVSRRYENQHIIVADIVKLLRDYGVQCTVTVSTAGRP